MNVEEKIKNVVEKLQPFLMSDGGFIEFVKYEDNIAYVKLSGACEGCALIDYTLKDGIEVAITSEVPEVLEVRNVTE